MSGLIGLVAHARKFGQFKCLRAFQIRLFLILVFGAEFTVPVAVTNAR